MKADARAPSPARSQYINHLIQLELKDPSGLDWRDFAEGWDMTLDAVRLRVKRLKSKGRNELQTRR